jgi:hypothetical protein
MDAWNLIATVYSIQTSYGVNQPLEFNASTAPSTSKLFLVSVIFFTLISCLVSLFFMDNHHLFTKPKKSKSSDLRFTEVVTLESILTHVPLEGTNTDPFPKTVTLIRFIVIANF